MHYHVRFLFVIAQLTFFWKIPTSSFFVPRLRLNQHASFDLHSALQIDYSMFAFDPQIPPPPINVPIVHSIVYIKLKSHYTK